MSGNDYDVRREKRHEVAGNPKVDDNVKSDIPTVNVSINIQKPMEHVVPETRPLNESSRGFDTTRTNEDLKEKGKEKFEDLKEKGKEKFEDVKNKAKETYDQGKEKLEDVKEKGKEKAEDVKDKAKEKEYQGKEKAEDLKEKGKEKLEDVKEKGKEKTEDVKDKAKEKEQQGKEKLEDVKEKGKEKGREVKDKAKETYDQGKEKAEDIKEKGKEKLEDVKEKGKEKTEEVKDKAKETYDKGKEKAEDIKEKGKEKLEDVKEKAEDVKEKGKEKIEEGKEKLEETLNMESLLKSAKRCLENFTNPKLAMEKQIPVRILSGAFALVFLTEYKGSFGIGSSMGTGVIIARKENKQGWTGPCAIAMGGLSIGFQAGLQKIEHVMVLHDQDALKIFASKGQFKLGGDLSFAIGPLGRDAQMSVNVNDKDFAAIYSYSMCKGLHLGASLNGQLIVIRDDCNEKYYGKKVSAKEILLGNVDSLSNDNMYSSLIKLVEEYTQKQGQVSEDLFTQEEDVQHDKYSKEKSEDTNKNKASYEVPAKAETIFPWEKQAPINPEFNKQENTWSKDTSKDNTWSKHDDKSDLLGSNKDQKSDILGFGKEQKTDLFGSNKDQDLLGSNKNQQIDLLGYNKDNKTDLLGSDKDKTNLLGSDKDKTNLLGSNKGRDEVRVVTDIHKEAIVHKQDDNKKQIL